MSAPVLLNALVHHANPPSADRLPLIFLHGVFGNANNWAGILRRLHPGYTTVSMDLRNHGASPHTPRMDYPSMAADVLATLDHLGIGRCSVVGHSMGGKVAMALAHLAPQRFASVVVEDIAPVAYSDRYSNMIAALLAAPDSLMLSRQQIHDALTPHVPNPQTLAFLMQNYRRGETRWAWRCNLVAIRDSLADLLGFPDFEPLGARTAMQAEAATDRVDSMRTVGTVESEDSVGPEGPVKPKDSVGPEGTLKPKEIMGPENTEDLTGAADMTGVGGSGDTADKAARNAAPKLIPRVTLIAAGPRGLAHDAAGHQAFLQHFPQGEIVTIPEAGHWVHVDAPEAFEACLLRAI